jgi:predicted nucleotidyltransferase
VFYLDLFRALQEAEVRYLLVGGVAVNLHGIELPIAPVEDIIRLKTGTGRQKDEADIKALRQLLRMESAPYAS